MHSNNYNEECSFTFTPGTRGSGPWVDMPKRENLQAADRSVEEKDLDKKKDCQ